MIVATVNRFIEAASMVHYFESLWPYAKHDPKHRKASSWYGASVTVVQPAMLYTRKRKDERSRAELSRIWQARMA